MLDVHPPHHPTHTWKDFFIHIATITVGLLIAIGLEQTVEFFHHRHQREALDADLREEARRNREIILRDLTMTQQEAWFLTASADAADPVRNGAVSFSLPPAPCAAGYLGTAHARYFAPSEAVWTTARENGLTALIPAEQARIYARLAHNDDLLAITREKMAVACERVLSLQSRFAVLSPDGSAAAWTMRQEQSDRMGDATADGYTALRALLSRLRWTLSYEDAILNGTGNVDQLMMEANQKDFEN
jgi:hypothetical protein